MFEINPANEDKGNCLPQSGDCSPGLNQKYRVTAKDAVLSFGQSIDPKQLSECARLYSVSFQGPPWFEKWTKSKASKEIRTQLAAGAWIILATDPNNAIVGLAITIPLRLSPRVGDFEGLPLSKQCWYFSDFCVARDAQGSGLGKRLLQAACELSIATGGDSMLTRTRLDNLVARKAFERLQFEVVATSQSETGGCVSERVVYLKEFSRMGPI